MSAQLAQLKAVHDKSNSSPDKKKSKKELREEEELEKGVVVATGEKEIDDLKESIGRIESNTQRMVQLNAKTHFSPEENKEILSELENLILSNKKEAMRTKDALNKLEKETKQVESTQPGSTAAQIRRNNLDVLNKRLQTAVLGYQEAGGAVRNEMRDNIRRQTKLVGGQITEEQVEQAVEAADPGFVLREALGITDVALDAVSTLEERHERMKAIEQGVKEVLELFQDMAVLVDQQGDMVNNIQSNVSQARTRTEAGTKALVEASGKQRKGRKFMYIAFGGTVIVLLIIIIALATKH